MFLVVEWFIKTLTKRSFVLGFLAGDSWSTKVLAGDFYSLIQCYINGLETLLLVTIQSQWIVTPLCEFDVLLKGLH